MDNQYTIYTDGGCAWNPGGPGAAASIIIKPDRSLQKIVNSYHATTNNRMEIKAVIQALQIIPKGTYIELYSDSKYVLKVLAGKYARKKNLDLWKQMDNAASGLHINLHWVHGHSGILYNEQCDQLCSLGMITPQDEDEGYIESIFNDNEHLKSSYQDDNSWQFTEHLNAMTVDIRLPKDYRERTIVFIPTKDYVEMYSVNNACALSIFEFYSENKHNFRSYKKLKSHGYDHWSSLETSDILQDDPQKAVILETLENNLPNEKLQKSAVRWYARGLTLEDAIRKVLVDEEVTYNAIHKKEKYNEENYYNL